MFDFLKKGASSILAKIFLAVIIIVFVFWGIGYFGDYQKDIIAEVNGEKINLREFQEYYNFKVSQLKHTLGSISEEDLKKMKFKDIVLQELIQRRILEKIAEDLDIKVLPEEITLTLSNFPFFQENNKFSPARYQAFLREFDLTSKGFEKILALNLLEQKIKLFLTSPILISEKELLDFASFYEQKVTFYEFLKTFSSCERDISLDDKTLENYYLTHRDLYYEEEKVKIAYYFLPYSKEVEVTEEEIKNYYTQNLHRFKEPFKVKVRRILIPESDPLAKKKVEEIKGRLKTLEDFVKFGVKKGEWFEEEALPSEIKNSLKLVKKGDILGPIKISQGYLILGIEDLKPEGFLKLEEIREQLIREIKEEKSKALAKEKANQIYLKVAQENGLINFAKKEGLKLREMNYLGLEELSKLFFSREITREILRESKGSYLAPIEGEGGIYLIEILDKTPRKSLSFEEAKERVKRDYLREKGRERCQAKGYEFLIKAKEIKEIEGLAKEKGFQVFLKTEIRRKLPEEIINRGSLGLVEKYFLTEEGIKLFYILKIEPQEVYKEAVKNYYQSLLDLKRGEIVKKVFEEYQRKAKIKIYPLFNQI